MEEKEGRSENGRRAFWIKDTEWTDRNEPTHILQTDPQPWSRVGKDGLCYYDVQMTLEWGRAGDMVSSTNKKQQVHLKKSITEIKARFKTRKHLEGTLKTFYRQGKPTFLWIDTQSIKHDIWKVLTCGLPRWFYGSRALAVKAGGSKFKSPAPV